MLAPSFYVLHQSPPPPSSLSLLSFSVPAAAVPMNQHSITPLLPSLKRERDGWRKEAVHIGGGISNPSLPPTANAMQCNAAATVVGKESFRQPKAVVHAEVELELGEGGESGATAVHPCTSGRSVSRSTVGLSVNGRTDDGPWRPPLQSALNLRLESEIVQAAKATLPPPHHLLYPFPFLPPLKDCFMASPLGCPTDFTPSYLPTDFKAK